MDQIAVSKFKATCLAVLQKVRKTRKPVLVTRFGVPIAEVAPAPPRAKPDHWMGSLAGTGRIKGNIVSSASDPSDWEALG